MQIPFTMRDACVAACVVALVAAPAAWAQNKGGGGGSTTPASGVVVIDQAKAEAGGVTSGDAPGFPIHIGQPGHYRLMSNLVVADPNVDVIQVLVDNVTIDLNGFTIQGATSCSGVTAAYTCTPNNGSGIGVRSNSRTLVTVRNGTVRGFQAGVMVGSHSRVEDLNVAESRVVGIVSSTGSIVTRNLVTGGENGLWASGVVRDNAIDNIRNYGVMVQSPATLLQGNSLSRMGGVGIWATSGMAIGGVAFNAISNSTGPAISGGVSLGDGQTNLCNTTKC